MYDSNGAYMNTNSVKNHNHVTFQSETTPSAKYAYFGGKSQFVKQRDSRSYVNITVLNDEVYLNKIIYRKNKNLKAL